MSTPPPPGADPVARALTELLASPVEVSDTTLLEGLARLYLRLGRASDALRCLQEAQNQPRQARDPVQEARILRELGEVYQGLGRTQEATRAWQEALEASNEVDDYAGAAEARYWMGRYHEAQARYLDALEQYTDAAALYRMSHDDEQQAHVMSAIGNVYLFLGQFAEALRAYSNALAIFEASGNRLAKAEALRQLATIHLSLGRFEEAIRTGQEVHDLQVELGLKERYHGTYMTMGSAYRGLGDQRKAVEYFEKAVAEATQHNDQHTLVNGLVALGRAFRLNNQHRDATKTLGQAVDKARRLGDRNLLGEIIAQMGLTLSATGHWNEAQQSLNEATNVLKGAGDIHGAAKAQINLGNVLVQSGMYDEAEEVMARAYALAQDTGDSEMLATIFTSLGSVVNHLGRRDEAMKWFQNAIDAMDDPVGTQEGGELSHPRLGKHLDAYESLIDIYFSTNRPLEGLRVAERAHGRRCVEQMEGFVLAETAGLGSPTVQECERLMLQIHGANLKLGQTRDKSGRRNLHEHINNLRTQLQEALQKAEEKAPDYMMLRSVRTIPAAELQSIMEPDTGVIIYFVGLHQTYIWVVTSAGVGSAVVPVLKKDLARMARELYRTVRHKAGEHEVLQASHILSNTILRPAEFALAACRRVLVVPDGPLHGVPFGALLTSDNVFFAHRWDLCTVPSVTLWHICRNKGKNIWRARSTRRDLVTTISPQDRRALLDRVKAIRSGEQRVIEAVPDSDTLGQNFTEVTPSDTVAAFVQGFKEAVLLHIAIPLSLRDDNPTGAQLSLADGSVDLESLTRRSSASRLVLFSATDFDLSERDTGNAWISFCLGLLFSGVPSAVYSLWRPDEETRKVFASRMFYHIGRGINKGQALRRAQLDLMRSPERGHPYFWAGFELFGDWS